MVKKINVTDMDAEGRLNVLIYFDRIRGGKKAEIRYPVTASEIFVAPAIMRVVHFTDSGTVKKACSIRADINKRILWGQSLIQVVEALPIKTIYSIHPERVAKLALRWACMFGGLDFPNTLAPPWIDLCKKIYGDEVILTFEERKQFDSFTTMGWWCDGAQALMRPVGDEERDALIKLCLI